MKITLVTEHKVIIGELVQAAKGGCSCEGCRAIHVCCDDCLPQRVYDPGHLCGVSCQCGNEYAGIKYALTESEEAMQPEADDHNCLCDCNNEPTCGCTDCYNRRLGPEGHIASSSPLQDADTPLGTPPTTFDGYEEVPVTTLPAAMTALPPCAVGDYVSLNVMITNIVERNG